MQSYYEVSDEEKLVILDYIKENWSVWTTHTLRGNIFTTYVASGHMFWVRESKDSCSWSFEEYQPGHIGPLLPTHRGDGLASSLRKNFLVEEGTSLLGYIMSI